MTRAAMTFVIAVLFSLAATFIAGGDACNNVPTMSWGDACVKACKGQPWYKLCAVTIGGVGPDTAEVSVYAAIAAGQAKFKYQDTMAAMDQALEGGGGSSSLAGGSSSLAGGERDAVVQCRDSYAAARRLMFGVAGQMAGCDFSRARQDYLAAVAVVASCEGKLRSFKSSLSAMVAADLELTMVAYDLGALIVGR